MYYKILHSTYFARRKKNQENGKLTRCVVNIEEGSERISLRYESIANLTWNTFVAILSVNLQNLVRESSN